LKEEEMNNRSMRYGLRTIASIVALVVFACVGAVGATAGRQGEPSSTSPPTIQGKPQPGQTLTTTNGSWTNHPTLFGYQWYRCDSGGNNCKGIAGATSRSYTLTTNDIGFRLVVHVAAQNADGRSSRASAVTNTVSPSGAPKSTQRPQISGKAQVGQTLTVSRGEWTGNPSGFSYQWLRCDQNGNNCAAVAGATASSYGVRPEDSGKSLRVLVTAANSSGKASATTDRTAQIPATGAPRNTQRPAISGTPRVGQTLSVSPGQWTGSPGSFSYQWMRCDQDGNACANVAGANSSTYGVRSDDSGKTIRVLVTAANSAGGASVTTDRSAQIEPVASTQGTSCNGSRVIAASGLQPPMRMVIDRWSFTPSLLRRGTQFITARVHVADSCGRSVTGAQIWSTAIPYNQTTTVRGATAADGWATLQLRTLRGFPANPGRQQILAMLIRATKPGGSVLAGVSTRRAVRLDVRLP
jgi:hypothetical protein